MQARLAAARGNGDRALIEVWPGSDLNDKHVSYDTIILGPIHATAGGNLVSENYEGRS